MPKPKSVEVHDDDSITYILNVPDVSSLAHRGKNYPVVDGKVSIPKTDTWHLDLVGTFMVEA